jgi:glucose/arabinose dehydrogenase
MNLKKMKLTLITALVLAICLSSQLLAEEPSPADYYPITDIPLPEGEVIEVSGIDILPEGKVAVASRRGDIWVGENVLTSNADNPPKWTLFARGLHEVLGIAWKDGWLYLTQRPEVSRIKDSDGDGRADIFETVGDGWGINGDYHEYAFGTRHDKDGNIWVVLCLTGSGGASDQSPFRGWCMRVTPDGQTIPTAYGIRSPGGIGFNHLGDVFYCDNQGPWNGSSSLKHIAPGSFQGNPTGNRYFSLTDVLGPKPEDPKSGSRIETERKRLPAFIPPPVVLTHGELGNSPAGVECDETNGKFGPFQNQLFVSEQTHSKVHRIFLEKVNGYYQGAAFPFLKGFGSGNIVARFAPDGTLITGGTNRGWGSHGKKPFSLQRVNWTGKVPFEIHEMHAKPDGFHLTFTQEADKATLEDPKSYSMECYTYIYQGSYGSPVVDRTEPTIAKATAGKDGKSVHLVIDGLVKGNVHELRLPGVRTKDGSTPLLNPAAYYTLNEIPSK